MTTTSTDHDAAARVAADRQDIRDLCARYAIALDDHDWTALGEVFAPDAVMAFAHVGDVTGVEAIAAICGDRTR